MTDDLVLYGGTYLNKGGAAIVYGTLKVLRNLGLKFQYVVDPEAQLPFDELGLSPIYRYSDTFSVNPIPSVNPLYTAKPFARCVVNSFSKDVKQLKGLPVWHIGDSPFGDAHSGLSIVGQIISLSTLKHALKSRAIVGGVSLAHPRTRIGKMTLPGYFKNDIDYTYTRGTYTNKNLKSWGVNEKNYSAICDFAFYNTKDEKYSISAEFQKQLNQSEKSGKPKVALILRDYMSGEVSATYLQSLRRLITQLESMNYDLYYVPTTYAFLIPENDYNYMSNILQVPKDKIIWIKDNTPSEIISIMSNFDCVVSTRLHGAILGTLAHVPTIHLYEGGKSQEVLETVYGNDLVPMVHLSDLTYHPDEVNIPKIIGDVISDTDTISTSFKRMINEATSLSFKHLKETYAEVLNLK